MTQQRKPLDRGGRWGMLAVWFFNVDFSSGSLLNLKPALGLGMFPVCVLLTEQAPQSWMVSGKSLILNL